MEYNSLILTLQTLFNLKQIQIRIVNDFADAGLIIGEVQFPYFLPLIRLIVSLACRTQPCTGCLRWSPSVSMCASHMTVIQPQLSPCAAHAASNADQ